MREGERKEGREERRERRGGRKGGREEEKKVNLCTNLICKEPGRSKTTSNRSLIPSVEQRQVQTCK